MTKTLRSPWVIMLSAALIVTVGMGVRQSFGLMLAPISLDLEIGRQTFGLAIALQNLIFGLIQPFIGAYVDRRGSGRVVAAGAMTYVAGLVLAAHAADAVMLNLSLGLLVGLALSATTFVVVVGPVARAVAPEKRSQALGLVTAGGSLGQFFVVPAVQACLAVFDWRPTLLVMAGVAAVMAVLALGVAGKPAEVAERPDLGLRAALREAAMNRSYWLLTLGFFVCGFHLTFVGAHLPAYLADRGLPPGVGAWALALIGLFNIAGSYMFGHWGGIYSKKQLLSLLYFTRALAILVFVVVPLSTWSTLAFSAVFGFVWLGTAPLTSGLVAQIFGLRRLSTLYGIVFLSHQVGSFFGAWGAGLAYDATGSYGPVWMLSILLAVMAGLINLPIDERPIAEQVEVAA